MDDNKQIKISLSTFLLIIAIIVILAMTYFIYNILKEKNIAESETTTLIAKVNSLENTLSSMEIESSNKDSNNTKSQEDATIKENINNSDNIPTEDLFAIEYNVIANSQMDPCIVKISNGNLYYLDKNKIDTIKYYSPCEEDYVKIDSNVKRIKSLTLGTDTSVGYLIIKNDGTVKTLSKGNSGFLTELYEELKDYKVDDITDFNGETFTLKLIDGTTKKVNHFSGG